MARLPNPGGDEGTWGSILNDFLGQVHNSDGTLKDDSVTAASIAPNAVDSTVVADGSITPAKLSQTYVQTSAVASPNGVASLDGSGKVPSGQLPTTTTPDATTSSKGIVQLTNDFGGTATAPTVTSTHLSSALPVNQGGTGSTTQNFVDLSNAQSVGGVKTFTSAPVVPSNSFPESAITNLTADLATIPSVPQPADNYLYGWTGPPEFFVSNVAPTATEVYLQRIIVTANATINNLYFFVTSAGSGMTANRNFVGLYNASGTRLGLSADCSSSWTSTHVAKIALTSGVSVTKGQIIYAAMLFTGTSMPQLAGGAQSYWDQPNVGNGVANWASASPPYNVLAPNHFRYMTWSVGETALPASIDLNYGNPDKAFWVGVG